MRRQHHLRGANETTPTKEEGKAAPPQRRQKKAAAPKRCNQHYTNEGAGESSTTQKGGRRRQHHPRRATSTTPTKVEEKTAPPKRRETAWASCSTSVLIQNVLSQVQPFRKFATHPFVGLLVPAACSLLSHSTDCQHTDSRIANPKHYHYPDFISAVKLADKNSSHPPHVQLGSILKIVSPRAHLSKWHNFSSVVLAPNRMIKRSPRSLQMEICLQSMHSGLPSTHGQVQLLSCISLRRHLEMPEAVPES